MTREKALAVTKALNDIEDFEMFMDEVEKVYQTVEGDIATFYETKLLPLMNAELANRKSVLLAM